MLDPTFETQMDQLKPGEISQPFKSQFGWHIVQVVERKTVQDSGLQIEQVSRFWLHQANLNMNLLIARTLLGRDALPGEAPVILDEYANTSSAGSIIAFHKYQQDLASGQHGVICSFGAGYSIGCVVVKKR
ncbi:MAG: peptidylprolyl isomerase [Burkholderiales bacterium]|nr:peptidylprolyl isomerase [Burkholderiales bacterium]